MKNSITAPPSAPVGVEELNAAAVDAGHTTFESMKQCADSWFAIVDTLNTVAPGWSEKEGTGRECATATIAALAQQPAAKQDCGNCGGFGDVSGEYPGDACPDCRGTGKVPAQQPAAAGEEIMVNAAHDVYTLPLQPSGLSSGPRFVVHVPGPEQPAAVDGADAQAAEIEALKERDEKRGIYIREQWAEIEALRSEVRQEQDYAAGAARRVLTAQLAQRRAEARAERMAEELRELSQCDGSPANVLNAEVLAGRVRSIATKALRDHDQEGE